MSAVSRACRAALFAVTLAVAVACCDDDGGRVALRDAAGTEVARFEYPPD